MIVFWQLVIGTIPILVVWAALRYPPDLVQAGRGQWLAALFLGALGNGFAYFA